jgi:RNA polymerase sigma factor (sigma-70 family)
MASTRSAAGGLDNSITALLAQLSEGNRDAGARLIPQVYEELRRVTGHYIQFVGHAILPSHDQSIDVLALHEALEHLTNFDPRQGRIVELHFFGGLSFEEIALILHISERTVKRDWSMARAWLKGELSRQP